MANADKFLHKILCLVNNSANFTFTILMKLKYPPKKKIQKKTSFNILVMLNKAESILDILLANN